MTRVKFCLFYPRLCTTFNIFRLFVFLNNFVFYFWRKYTTLGGIEWKSLSCSHFYILFIERRSLKFRTWEWLFKKTVMIWKILSGLSKSVMIFKGLKMLFVGFDDIFIFEESCGGCKDVIGFVLFERSCLLMKKLHFLMMEFIWGT